MRELFLQIIRELDNILRTNLNTVVDEMHLPTLLFLLLISFIYGIAHSAGPGHGKSLVLSFFLKEKHPVLRSVTLAGIISLVHSGSALIIAFIISFILKGVRGFFQIKLQKYFMLSSGIMILAVGVLFLVLKILKKDGHNDEHEPNGKTNLFLIGVSAGIVPCPVSLMIMIFTISRGIMHVGIMIVASISFGMFLLLSTIGFFSIKVREKVEVLSNEKKHITLHFLEYSSVIFIMIVGFSLVISNI